jgi:hypothetical protein
LGVADPEVQLHREGGVDPAGPHRAGGGARLQPLGPRSALDVVAGPRPGADEAT